MKPCIFSEDLRKPRAESGLFREALGQRWMGVDPAPALTLAFVVPYA